ncbi:MAG: ATP-binding protein [Phycisphaerales bacterium]
MPAPRPGLLARLRVRKKLIVLHTLFSLLLAVVVLVTLRPAVASVVREAEVDEAVLILSTVQDSPQVRERGELPDTVRHARGEQTRLLVGTAPEVGVSAEAAAAAIAQNGNAVAATSSVAGPGALSYLGRGDAGDRYAVLSVSIERARSEAVRLYTLAAAALLAVYVLVAAALELFVLPQSVYRPIRRMLEADDAVQRGDKDAELIPPREIPSDELGEIMRSRNESIIKLRRQEAALADALASLEHIATDLKRKNHLLETAQRNLADADRLAGLGTMSAGIAHELNTPLAVVKGLTEKLNQNPRGGLAEAEAALMLRVVGRLERLGESLLDYARVRPPRSARAHVRAMVDDALTLVRIDQGAKGVDFAVSVPAELHIDCDADRIVQVMVNLLRNAVHALRGQEQRRVEVAASVTLRQDGADSRRPWVSIRVTDNGPGIDASVLPRLFEPFASTRLDSNGTGLGLAVSEGIAREHGGVLLAGNRTEARGAEFELLLPAEEGLHPPDRTTLA